MHVFVKYNKDLDNNLEELKKFEYEPVIVYEFLLDKKTDKNFLLNGIKNAKKKYENHKSAILLIIENPDNSFLGFINSFHNDFDIIIGLGGTNKVNRFYLENTNIDFLMDPHSTYFMNKIDFIHHFNSGLNHILCKFASEKNIGFVFSLDFFYGEKKNIAKNIGRINQNIRFARKYNIPIYMNYMIKDKFEIMSEKQIKSIMSFFDVSTIQTVNCIKSLDDKIEKNSFKKSKNYISEGIYFENLE